MPAIMSIFFLKNMFDFILRIHSLPWPQHYVIKIWAFFILNTWLLGLQGALGHLGAILGPSWGHLGAILGLSWAILGLLWGHLGVILGFPGAIWGHFGPFWAILGLLKTSVSRGPSANFGRNFGSKLKLSKTWPKMAPRWPKDGPRWLQDGPR